MYYCRALSPNVFSTSLLLKQLFTKHNRPLPPSLFTFSFPHVLLSGAARVLYLSTKLLTRIGKRGGGITPFAVASPIPYGASESDVLPNTAAVRRELIPVSSSTTALTRWWLFPFYPASFESLLLVLYNIGLLYSFEIDTCSDLKKVEAISVLCFCLKCHFEVKKLLSDAI